MTMDVYNQQLQHIDSVWPQNKKERFSWELGRIQKDLANFSVVRVEPKSLGDSWVYLTSGAWKVDINKDYRFEFFIMTPFEEARHVETLAMLASYFSDDKNHLEVGSAVNIGRGWLEGSKFDHLLISLPYPFGPNLEVCKINDALTIRYLWVMPISASEYTYLNTNGLEELESKFDQAGVDYLNPMRESVV